MSGVERVMIVVKGEGAMSKGKGFIGLLPPVQFVRAASSCTTVVGSGLDSFRMEMDLIYQINPNDTLFTKSNLIY